MYNKQDHEVNHKLGFYNSLKIFPKYIGWRGLNTTHRRILVLLAAMIATAQVGAAAVITVGNTSDTDYLNIQDAINEANDGDIIQVWSGTYNEHLIINKPLKVESKNGAANTLIDGMETEVVVNITSDNVTFNGFTIQNGQTGIRVIGNNNEIIYNSIRNIAGAGKGESSYGIYLYHVTNNNVSYNNILNIRGIEGSRCITYTPSCDGGNSYGIYLNSGTNNHLSNNMISSIIAGIGGVIQPNTMSVVGGRGGNGIGIFLYSGTNNRIFRNIIDYVYGNKGGAGVYYYYPPFPFPPEFYGRGGSGGNGYGISLSSEDNKIFENTISDVHKGAGGSGGAIIGSSGKGYCIAAFPISNKNMIYYNNFINSDTQDGFDSSGNNTWDEGPISGGNYWSDYSGNDTNSDGIGDIPYELAGGSGAKDFYPFMEPISEKIDVYTGWNLISLSLMPEDTDIISVLTSINGNFSIVWAYNATDTEDHWKKYDQGAPFGNDLTTMEAGKGYWIMMTNNDTLPITGRNMIQVHPLEMT